MGKRLLLLLRSFSSNHSTAVGDGSATRGLVGLTVHQDYRTLGSKPTTAVNLMDSGVEKYHITGRFKAKPGSSHTRFACELVVRKGMVIKAGPMLDMMVGWTLSRVESYIASKESLKLHSGGI